MLKWPGHIGRFPRIFFSKKTPSSNVFLFGQSKLDYLLFKKRVVMFELNLLIRNKLDMICVKKNSETLPMYTKEAFENMRNSETR